MKRSFKFILSWFCVIVICFSLSAPAFAAPIPTFAQVDKWQWIYDHFNDVTTGAKEYVQSFFSKTDSGCSKSPDGYHVWVGDILYGSVTGQFLVHCSSCGQDYHEFLTGTAGSFSKEDMSKLEKGGFGGGTSSGGGGGRKFSKVDSSGGLYWCPTINDIVGKVSIRNESLLISDFPYSYIDTYFYSIFSSRAFRYDDIQKGNQNSRVNGAGFGFALKVPITGLYTRQKSIAYTSKAYDSADLPPVDMTDYYSVSNSGAVAGNSISNFVYFSLYNGQYFKTGSAFLYLPIYKVIPQNSISGYTPDTRFSNLNGSLGYMDSSGKLTPINNTQIINETTNVYYNPITNNTQNITNWTYDYSDRSYHVTFEDNSVTNITYNDEYITINEGDTVYNIYYIVQNPDACDHDYTSAVTKEPTCLETGTRTYTCSKCHKSYDERIAAKGHTWELKETVKSEYDENGELLTQGFTIYQCSVCGEQYKDIDGTGPPMPKPDDSGGSGDSSGIIDWLKKIYDAVKNINVDVNISGSEETDNKTWIDGFIGKFGWLHSVYEIGESFARDIVGDQATAVALADNPDAQIAGPAAPNITADLSAAASPYGHVYGTGEITVLDLSWYTPYKPTVDKLISGFLWIAFLWGLFKRAPDIISGAGITENKIDDLKGGKR